MDVEFMKRLSQVRQHGIKTHVYVCPVFSVLLTIKTHSQWKVYTDMGARASLGFTLLHAYLVPKCSLMQSLVTSVQVAWFSKGHNHLDAVWGSDAVWDCYAAPSSNHVTAACLVYHPFAHTLTRLHTPSQGKARPNLSSASEHYQLSSRLNVIV